MFLVFFLFLPLPNQDDQLFLCRVLFCICRYSKLCLCIHIISLIETFCDRKRLFETGSHDFLEGNVMNIFGKRYQCTIPWTT